MKLIFLWKPQKNKELKRHQNYTLWTNTENMSSHPMIHASIKVEMLHLHADWFSIIKIIVLYLSAIWNPNTKFFLNSNDFFSKILLILIRYRCYMFFMLKTLNFIYLHHPVLLLLEMVEVSLYSIFLLA